VQVASDEAVSVALILNELILNAVKHSPPDGIAPTVSLTADGSCAEIVISNAVKNRRATDVDVVIDVDAGQGLGTGLRLVRSLLPDHGAKLEHALDAAGFMLTTLRLASPVVGNIHSKEAG
jgi:two-component sensor histidine kinase